MGIIKANIDEDLRRKLWEKAFKKFGYSKGAISMAIKEAVQRWVQEDEKSDEAESERILNNNAYLKLKERLEREYNGQYVLIAKGDFIAAAKTFDEIVKIANTKVPDVKHRLIFKVTKGEIRRRGRLGWRIRRKSIAGTT